MLQQEIDLLKVKKGTPQIKYKQLYDDIDKAIINEIIHGKQYNYGQQHINTLNFMNENFIHFKILLS